MTPLNLPDPRGLTFDRWSAESAARISVVTGAFIGEGSEKGWENWAARCGQIQALAQVPMASGFTNWQEWAQAMIAATDGGLNVG